MHLTHMVKNGFILCVTVIFSCTPAPEPHKARPPANFTSLEISYSNGREKKFSVLVDSSGIYFSPKFWDSCYYGVLPDHLFNLINTNVSHIRRLGVTEKITGCADCPVLAIKGRTNTDSLFLATNSIDTVLHPIIDSLNRFISIGHHRKAGAALFLETRQLITPRPPPIITK